ncbi:MAG TPA: cupredoxin family copper-binding protein [Longimicrobiales bacterium]
MFALRSAIPVLALLFGTNVHAQSVTERSPNLGTTWMAEARTVHFNFVHRFNVTPAPQRKLLNSPTFVLAARTPLQTMIGFAYASNSDIVNGVPNEWELFGRFVPRIDAGRTNVGLQVGWNAAALSADGALVLGQALGPVRVLATGRAFSNAFDGGEARFAAGGGLVLQLMRWLALSGDAVTLLDRAAGERVAWSGGLQLGIPTTPHTMSLHATNTNTTTLEGASRGTSTVRYGFEYTVPIHLDRFRRRRATVAASQPVSSDDGTLEQSASRDTVIVSIKNLAYSQTTLKVPAGAVVVWVNDDPLAHTVTADDGSFSSGEIKSGLRWSHRFDTPGTFEFYCTPHPFMRATIVVGEQ